MIRVDFGGSVPQTPTLPSLTPLSFLTQHSHYNGEKQHSSPQSDDEPSTPKARPNPKYQLFLGSNGSVASNGSVGDGGGPVGGGTNGNLTRISSAMRGSMESLSSRDWDSMSDRVSVRLSPLKKYIYIKIYKI